MLININNTNILHGISINNIDISCLSKEEATKKINEIIEKKYNTDIIIYYPNNTEKTISLESINTNYNVSSAISEAFNVGRTGNIFQNNFEIIKLMKNKKNIELDATVDNDKINNLINEISSNLPDKLVNVNYYIENTNLIITNGKNGSIIDKDTFLSKLNNIILDLNSDNNTIQAPMITANFEPINIDRIYNEIYKEEKDAYYEKEPFKIYPEVIGISFDKEYATNLLNNYQEEYVIPLTIVNPKITINNLGIDIFKDQLSTFTTKYSISNKERTTNLSLASSKINNTVIAPGEEFSYNKIVGARSIEAGYKEAKVYENGQVVDGIGGGICQISSTLYNTVMFANLEITERHNHQFITSYIPAGRDATVAYGSKDLKFKNNRSYPIKIKSSVSDGIVRISILGIKEDKEYDEISMNIVANLLGIGNAATPLGIKAMQTMQEKNKEKNKLTDSMVLFIVLNTASIQIIPTTVIAIRNSLGSLNPTKIIIPVWIATICAAISGITLTKILLKINRR